MKSRTYALLVLVIALGLLCWSFLPQKPEGEVAPEPEQALVVAGTPISPTPMATNPRDKIPEAVNRDTNSEVANVSESPETPPPPHETPPSLTYAKQNYDSFFKSFGKDFGPRSMRVIGKVNLDYGGYEGKYAVHFLLPRNLDQEKLATYEASISNPTAGWLGAGGFGSFTDGIAHLTGLGFIAHWSFVKKTNFDSLDLAARSVDPKQPKKLLYRVDPKKKSGTSKVSAWLDYVASDETPPEVDIGTMTYRIQDASLPVDLDEE